MAEKFTMSVPDAMKAALEDERKRRKLDTLQDTIRSILSEYFAGKAKR
jgi:transcriptional regulator of met regulon